MKMQEEVLKLIKNILKYIFKLSDNLDDGLNYFFSDFGTLIHSPVHFI